MLQSCIAAATHTLTRSVDDPSCTVFDIPHNVHAACEVWRTAGVNLTGVCVTSLGQERCNSCTMSCIGRGCSRLSGDQSANTCFSELPGAFSTLWWAGAGVAMCGQGHSTGHGL